MEYSKFVLTHHTLHSRLVSYAAHRITRTSEHIESETRARIAKLEKQKERMGIDLLISKQLPCDYHDIPRDLFQSIAYSDPTYRQISLELAAAKFSFMKMMRTDTTPNQQDYALAEQQVRDYFEALQNPSKYVYEYWGSKLSAREKHLLYSLDFLWYDENGKPCEAIVSTNDVTCWYNPLL
ncbi:hypothetical protein NIES37_73090 (plasmid) [Tolypothrix tenuis PCC 7101]|uniref:Uncharacterized protein n=1 Tax=Tolypothrix tenuis PCC 7101 TaxID=231146 RepID=A0A1Z4NC94_9CYAN|nr:hypothetical protein [Nostoc linckia FACHB-104]MBD2240568.1 hypothetical protein [Aulosira sp. FACHB-113]BAZ03296.1 hypothetical protein NIES37_73090 [Tolypothrix tenuis PCC 7101]BAZ78647.1 hypothetical protein NIES50_72800 [Aulosira laxa NIES-50]